MHRHICKIIMQSNYTKPSQLYKMQTDFTTERLLGNLITEEDNVFIRSLVNTEGWLQFIGDRNVHSEQDSAAYIRKIINTPDLFYWVIKLNESKVPIGIISFLKRSYLEHFDIGFAFLPQYTGHGYAHEAAGKVLSIVREARYDPVLATTVPHNINSIQLLTKLGLHFKEEINHENLILSIYST